MKPKFPIKRDTISPEMKEHYRNLHLWLKEHKEIDYRKLNPYGFSIDTRTISRDLIDEFIRISTFNKQN